MRILVVFFIVIFQNSVSAKEWKTLKQYQKETGKTKLAPSDWLKKDRRRNTETWQNANHFNLVNNLPKEYTTIIQRRDFYDWLHSELQQKKHEVVWIAMAHFISKKMRLMEVFPYSLLVRKTIKDHARHGSETVFNEAFGELHKLFVSEIIYKGDKALQKDKEILRKEQFIWIDGIYKSMDDKSLKTLSRIAKGKFLYGLLVHKSIRFQGELSEATSRYEYALETLRAYCQNRYKI